MGCLWMLNAFAGYRPVSPLLLPHCCQRLHNYPTRVRAVDKEPRYRCRGSLLSYYCKTLMSGGTQIRTGNTIISSPKTYVLARSIVSTKSADLQGFEAFSRRVCPLRATLYRPGCSTVAVSFTVEHRRRGGVDRGDRAPLSVPLERRRNRGLAGRGTQRRRPWARRS